MSTLLDRTVAKALDKVRPPPRLPLSQWIEGGKKKGLCLPEGLVADPGPVRLWAFQREIADAIGDPTIPRVTVKKCVRVGSPWASPARPSAPTCCPPSSASSGSRIMATKRTVGGAGITVEILLWRHGKVRGATPARLTQTLEMNPGLAALGAELPLGTVVMIPDLPPVTERAFTTAPAVSLFDD